MAETKGRKIYTLLSITDVEIIGLWSNLSSLIRDFNNGSTLLSYYKIYRLIKTHEENETIDIFEFNFTSVDGKKYKIKIKNLQ